MPVRVRSAFVCARKRVRVGDRLDACGFEKSMCMCGNEYETCHKCLCAYVRGESLHYSKIE